jgi:hypothetical protein
MIMKKKISEEVAEQIFDGDHPDYETVEEGEWISEGKYEHCSHIVKDVDEIYWEISSSRAGSYFTDYEYFSNTELIEVEQKIVKVTEWIAIPE